MSADEEKNPMIFLAQKVGGFFLGTGRAGPCWGRPTTGGQARRGHKTRLAAEKNCVSATCTSATAKTYL